MTVELREDLTMRELLDRCIKAELSARINERRAKNLLNWVQTAQRAKTMEKVQQALNSAVEQDMTLILALP